MTSSTSDEGATRVLFCWSPEPRLQQYIAKKLRDEPRVELVFPGPDAEPEELLDLAGDVEAIVGWNPSRELLDRARRLRLVINPGAGVRHLIERFRDVTADRKVTLVNGHGNAGFTAQHAVALLLALTNRIVVHHRAMEQGEWRTGDDLAPSLALRGRTVGLLGYGAINRQVHRLLGGFDLRFAALKTSWTGSNVPDSLQPFGTADLDDFLRATDTLIIAIPHTSRTEGMIGLRPLELLGSDGLVVNVARGAVVVEADLFEALSSDLIAGAAIDVWYDYRPEPNERGQRYPYSHPFHELPNVVLSPHRAASPFDDLLRWDEVVENLKRLARGEPDFLNRVDLEREY